MLYFEDIVVGQSDTVGDYLMAEQDIIEFAKEWDPQPFHVDVQEGKKAGFGGVTASSCHTISVTGKLHGKLHQFALIGAASMVVEMPYPTRAGDRLQLTRTILDKRQSRSKPDRGIVTVENLVKNQRSEIVLKETNTLLVRLKTDCSQ